MLNPIDTVTKNRYMAQAAWQKIDPNWYRTAGGLWTYDTTKGGTPAPTTPVATTGGTTPPISSLPPAPAPSQYGPSTGIVPPGGVQTGGNLPPTPVPVPPQPVPQQPQASMAPPDVVNQALDGFINGEYAQNARRRGIEFANSRGMGNSSIAGGASQRAALEAVQPLVNSAMQLHDQREQNAYTGDQAERDRQLRTKLQSDATFQQDWLSGRNFSRDFNGALSMIPINSAVDFTKQIQQYALENPEVYTQNTISGMTAFFTQNMQNILAKYFPSSYSTGTTTPGGH